MPAQALEIYLYFFFCPSQASLPCTGPDLLSIDLSYCFICLASQCTKRVETHYCLALANQETQFA